MKNVTPVILALDEGTTGIRAILYADDGNVVGASYLSFPQSFPRPGWVEHCPEKIWAVTRQVIRRALSQPAGPVQVEGIAITNQRETVVAWDSKTSKTVGSAIVWQDRRTANQCDLLKSRGHEPLIRNKTGLVIDPYFSATKMNWILNHRLQAKRLAKKKQLRFGTIDTWILWKLTDGKSFKTDQTNASRTLLYNIHRKHWDKQLMKIFSVPASTRPEVLNSSDSFGFTKGLRPLLPDGIPILSMIGDQQAALAGQMCFKKGDIKNTYGTGCFVVINAGSKKPKVVEGLLTTLAATRGGKPVYALEGSIFMGGAAVEWLHQGLRIISNPAASEIVAKKASADHGITVIPAFAGLGSPHWRSDLRGAIFGLTRGSGRPELVRAFLESIAHQSSDVIDLMQQVVGSPIRSLKVDGKATLNKFLMQIQADMLGKPVQVAHRTEATAWGAALLAGERLHFWKSDKILLRRCQYDMTSPKMSAKKRRRVRLAWKKQLSAFLHTI